MQEILQLPGVREAYDRTSQLDIKITSASSLSDKHSMLHRYYSGDPHEARLDPNHFIRIHRSAIVRSDGIREVHAEGSNRFRVILTDGTNLIVSRTRSQFLRRWML